MWARHLHRPRREPRRSATRYPREFNSRLPPGGCDAPSLPPAPHTRERLRRAERDGRPACVPGGVSGPRASPVHCGSLAYEDDPRLRCPQRPEHPDEPGVSLPPRRQVFSARRNGSSPFILLHSREAPSRTRLVSCVFEPGPRSGPSRFLPLLPNLSRPSGAAHTRGPAPASSSASLPASLLLPTLSADPTAQIT